LKEVSYMDLRELSHQALREEIGRMKAAVAAVRAALVACAVALCPAEGRNDGVSPAARAVLKSRIRELALLLDDVDRP